MSRSAKSPTFVVCVAAVTVAAVLSGAAPAAFACDQTSAGVSQADRDLWAAHGCRQDYFEWEARAYDVRSDDWSGRGFDDACNLNKEFAKHWNAAYLVSYGLPDDAVNRVQFHGTADYLPLAIGDDDQYHSETYQVATDDTSVFGRWNWRPIGDNQIETSCLLYDAPSPNANPASRAGDFLHEGWHGWLWQNWYWPDHQAGPQGACTMSGNACDYFYFHPMSQYAFGRLWYTDGTSRWFHSPNQVQVEFLCDVATSAAPWVPLSVRTAAAADANTRAVQRFINGPGYRCAAPKPFVGDVQVTTLN